MNDTNTSNRIRNYLKKHRFNKKVRYTGTALAAVVIAITTYTFIYPALTLEKNAACGIEEHEHTSSCYSSELICGLDESEGHAHTDECYQTEQVLVCGMEEHEHTDDCYDEDGNIICGIEEHGHNEACQDEVRTLICGQEEYEGHHHTDACYADVLACGKEVHVHSVSCYREDETEPSASYSVNEEQIETAPLPGIDFGKTLTDLTGIWYQNPDGTWTLAGEDTAFSPDVYVLIHIAYDIPQGSLDAGNARIIYKLPKSLMITDEDAEMANKDGNYLNQLITGSRLPNEQIDENTPEYLAGKYILNQDEDGNWQLVITFNEYSIETNSSQSINGWLMFYMKGSDLKVNSRGKGKAIFAKKAANGKKLRIKYIVKESETETETETETQGYAENAENAENNSKELSETVDLSGTVDPAEAADLSGTADLTETAAGTENIESNINTESDVNINGDINTDNDINTDSDIDPNAAPESDSYTDENGISGEIEADETEADDDPEKITCPAQTFTETTEYVKVTVLAEEGTFPEGTTMKVSDVDDSDIVDSIIDSVKEASDETGTRIRKVHAVDITFYDADGEETEPLRNVCVAMEPLSAEITTDDRAADNSTDSTEADAPLVVHVEEDGTVNLIDQSDINEISVDLESDEELKETAELINEEAAVFEAESFSVYALVYTVDFHYEINGKMYDFSLPGGGFVSFTDLIEVLGIVDGTNNGQNEDENASESDESFTADVELIEFSSPSLMAVNKVDTDTTVGEFKNRLGLTCEYSAELTQDQINDINAQPLYAGDWVLISHAPFDSEETLTVTMRTGEVFTIRVTDDAKTTDEVNASTGYLLYYKDGDTYYVLKADGTTATVSSTEEMDALSTEYQWTLTYVYVEDGIQRYNIRP